MYRQEEDGLTPGQLKKTKSAPTPTALKRDSYVDSSAECRTVAAVPTQKVVIVPAYPWMVEYREGIAHAESLAKKCQHRVSAFTSIKF